MSDEAKNQIPPRTPVEMQFRSTGPRFRPPTASSEMTANSAVDSQIPSHNVEQQEIENDDDDAMDPRNFLNNMYQNDNFL